MVTIIVKLISTRTEANQPSVNNNQVYHERLLSEQDFNSFEGNNGQVILAKPGDSAPSVLSILLGIYNNITNMTSNCQ